MSENQSCGLTEFTVKRSSWLRGTGGGSLLDDQGRQCCLGFYAEQAGVSREGLLNKGYPYAIRFDEAILEKMSPLVQKQWPNPQNTQLTLNAAAINDNERIPDEERERRLIELFAKHNITLHFED